MRNSISSSTVAFEPFVDTERRDRVEVSSRRKTDAAEAIDVAVKDLIDNLIVPNLVEEFLRLYRPAFVVKPNQFRDRNLQSQPDSELDSTP